MLFLTRGPTLAALAPQERVAIRAGALRRAQDSPHPSQNPGGYLRQLRFVQREVYLLRSPTRKGAARRRRAQPPALQGVDRQTG